MEEKSKILVDAVKKDDVTAFANNFDKQTATLRAGRFPLLSLCYLYGSKKIIRKYEKELLTQSHYTACEEDRESFLLFRDKAGRALRLYLQDSVSPLEMLAVLGKHEYLAEVYAVGYKDEKIRANIEYIESTLYDNPTEFGRNEIKIRQKKLSPVQKKTVFSAAVLSVVFCVLAVLGLLYGLQTGKGTEDSPIYLSDERQLALALTTDSYYKLKKDIVWNREGVSSFGGTIDGDGHTVTVTAMENPFIGTLTGTIKNVTFYVPSFDKKTEENYSVILGENQGTLLAVMLNAGGKMTVVQQDYCSDRTTNNGVTSCDCNVFQAGKENLCRQTSATIGETAAEYFDYTAKCFTYLVEKYSGTALTQWTANDSYNYATYYNLFYTQIKTLMSATQKGSKAEYTASKGIIVGINRPFTFTASEVPVYADMANQTAKLFGFDDVERFRTEAEKVLTVLTENKAGANIDTLQSRLPYTGAVYTASGYFVMPYILQQGTTVLPVCVLVGTKGVFVWVSDTDALNGLTAESAELYGRCSLFETKTVYLSLLSYKNIGTIKDCLANVTISASNTKTQNSFLSVFASWNEGTIQNCALTSSSKIIGETVDIGGFVAVNGDREGNGTIKECVLSGTVQQTTENSEWNPNVGGMVAYNYGTVSSCQGDATIIAKNKTQEETETPVLYAGGFICQNFGAIEDCSFTGTIDAEMPAQGIVGGIVALNLYDTAYMDETQSVQYTGAIDRCTSNAALQGLSTAGDIYCGGICGYSTAYVRECSGQGSIQGQGIGYIGGLVGVNKGIVSDGKSEVNISAGAKTYIGGIVGYNSYYIKTCKTAGKLTGGENSYVGGICGVNAYSSGYTIITACCGECTLESGKDGYEGGISAQNNGGVVEKCCSNCLYVLGDNQIAGYIVGLTDVSSLSYTVNGYAYYYSNNAYVTITGILYAIGEVSTDTPVENPETVLNIQATAYAGVEEMKQSSLYKGIQ